MRFNLYDLCEEQDKGKGRIKALMNPALKSKLKDAVYSNKPTAVARKLGMTYGRLWEFLNRSRSIPLVYLRIIEKNYGGNLIDAVDYLEYGAGATLRKVKAVSEVSEELAKILGAHAADGYLKERETLRSGRINTHYELVLREGSKSNVEAFCKWFNFVFGIDIKSKQSANHWYVYLSNKIVFRYFKNMFQFPDGRKSEIVTIPIFIKGSTNDIKRAFASGVLMFDGSVNYRNGYIELYSKSRKLVNEISLILKDLEIEPDYIKLDPDSFGRYRLVIRKKEKLRKSIILFEPNTDKWHRLKDQVDGFKPSSKEVVSILLELQERYPRVRPKTITFSDVLNVVYMLAQEGQYATFDNIAKALKRKSTVVYEFLRKLEDWDILISERNKNVKVWSLNDTWR